MKLKLLLIIALIFLVGCTLGSNYVVYHFNHMALGSGCSIYQAYEWNPKYDYQDVLDRKYDIDDIATEIEGEYCEVCNGLSGKWNTCGEIPLQTPFKKNTFGVPESPKETTLTPVPEIKYDDYSSCGFKEGKTIQVSGKFNEFDTCNMGNHYRGFIGIEISENCPIYILQYTGSSRPGSETTFYTDYEQGDNVEFTGEITKTDCLNSEGKVLYYLL